MVGHRQGQVRSADRPARPPQPFERLRRRHLMDEMPVDIDKAGAVRAPLDDMRIPDLLIERPRLCAHARSEEHTSELPSLMRISYAVFCLKKKKQNTNTSTRSKQTHTRNKCHNN